MFRQIIGWHIVGGCSVSLHLFSCRRDIVYCIDKSLGDIFLVFSQHSTHNNWSHSPITLPVGNCSTHPTIRRRWYTSVVCVCVRVCGGTKENWRKTAHRYNENCILVVWVLNSIPRKRRRRRRKQQQQLIRNAEDGEKKTMTTTIKTDCDVDNFYSLCLQKHEFQF